MGTHVSPTIRAAGTARKPRRCTPVVDKAPSTIHVPTVCLTSKMWFVFQADWACTVHHHSRWVGNSSSLVLTSGQASVARCVQRHKDGSTTQHRKKSSNCNNLVADSFNSEKYPYHGDACRIRVSSAWN